LKRLFGFAALAVSALVAAEVTALDEAQKLLDGGRAQAALEKSSSHVTANPTDPEGRFLQGLALAKMGKAEEAIKIFEALTLDYPNLPEPYNNLAVIRAQRGEYDKARGALEYAIQAHPTYGTAHENLGDIYTILATVAYNKALSLNGENNAVKVKLDMLRDLTSVSTSAGSPVSAPTKLPRVSAPIIASAKPASKDTPTLRFPQSSTSGLLAAPSGSNEPRAREKQPVSDALATWAEAWSRKDVPNYLSSYGASFQPPKNLDRASWEAQRTQRIGGTSGSIWVSVSNPQIRFLAKDLAMVTFVQRYKSATYNDKVTKNMLLENENGAWRIVREQRL
jgi:tetratricopeptide (TPR) repeat protein